MLKIINTAFVTMFGIGKLPRIPGSYASLVTVIFLYISFHIFSVPADTFLFLLVCIFIISLFAVNFFIKDLTNKDQINLKGKTVEKLGLIGKEEAIACEAIVSLNYYA